MNKLKGLQFLTPRNHSDFQGLLEYDSLFGQAIPPIFRLFCEIFELDKEFKSPKFFHEKYNSLYTMGDLYFKPLKDWPIRISKFDSLHKIFHNWDLKKAEDDWKKFKFLRIVSVDIGGGIYVGTEGKNKDKIFLIVWDWDENYIELADNIFEFVSSLEFSEDESKLYGYKYSQFYKNWGDGYWKVHIENNS